MKKKKTDEIWEQRRTEAAVGKSHEENEEDKHEMKNV